MSAVVITGSRRYIGSALSARLSADGHQLTLVSRISDVPSAEERLDGRAEHLRVDLRDDAVWTRLIDDASAIVHLSSRTNLRSAELDPRGDEEINVEPVRALVRAAEKAAKPVNVIFASTVTIVGAEHENPVDERTPDRPCSVYDRHKLACETILRTPPIEDSCVHAASGFPTNTVMVAAP